MTVRDQDHRGVAMPVPVLTDRLDQLPDLGVSKVLACAQFRVLAAERHDCPIFGCWHYRPERRFCHCFQTLPESAVRTMNIFRTVVKVYFIRHPSAGTRLRIPPHGRQALHEDRTRTPRLRWRNGLPIIGGRWLVQHLDDLSPNRLDFFIGSRGAHAPVPVGEAVRPFVLYRTDQGFHAPIPGGTRVSRQHRLALLQSPEMTGDHVDNEANAWARNRRVGRRLRELALHCGEPSLECSGAHFAAFAASIAASRASDSEASKIFTLRSTSVENTTASSIVKSPAAQAWCTASNDFTASIIVSNGGN